MAFINCFATAVHCRCHALKRQPAQPSLSRGAGRSAKDLDNTLPRFRLGNIFLAWIVVGRL